MMILLVLHDRMMFVFAVVMLVLMGVDALHVHVAGGIGRFEVMIPGNVPGFPGDFHGREQARENDSKEGTPLSKCSHPKRILAAPAEANHMI